MGLKRAGYRVVGAIDCDAGALESYRANHRDVHIWESDIRALSVADTLRRLRIQAGSLELLAGCPPCQGFSDLRTRNGFRRRYDMRNSLIDEFLRFVRGARPKAVLLENVPSLADHWRFTNFRRAMRRLNYREVHEVRDAADFGVPQRRKRLIYMAVRGSKPAFPSPRQKRRSVRDRKSVV